MPCKCSGNVSIVTINSGFLIPVANEQGLTRSRKVVRRASCLVCSSSWKCTRWLCSPPPTAPAPVEWEGLKRQCVALLNSMIQTFPPESPVTSTALL